MASNYNIENNYTYHKPTPEKIQDHEAIREFAKKMAYEIDAHCPDSREKSLAFTKLEEAVMWANAAIARN